MRKERTLCILARRIPKERDPKMKSRIRNIAKGIMNRRIPVDLWKNTKPAVGANNKSIAMINRWLNLSISVAEMEDV
jgi:hypothetical protein